MPEITFEQLRELLNSTNGILTAFIAGLFAILGSITGGLITRNTERNRAKKDIVRDAYMQFLSIVFVAMHKKDAETVERLGVAISKIEIFCSKSAAECADEIATQLLNGVKDRQLFSEQLDKFLLIAKKESV